MPFGAIIQEQSDSVGLCENSPFLATNVVLQEAPAAALRARTHVATKSHFHAEGMAFDILVSLELELDRKLRDLKGFIQGEVPFGTMIQFVTIPGYHPHWAYELSLYFCLHKLITNLHVLPLLVLELDVCKTDY